MSEKEINVIFYALRIERASNKEKEVKSILNELDEKYSLTRVELLSILEAFERYFQKKAPLRGYSKRDFPCKGGFEQNWPLWEATDNSEILDALGKVKKII